MGLTSGCRVRFWPIDAGRVNAAPVESEEKWAACAYALAAPEKIVERA